MTDLILKLDLLSYWHAGSGRGAAALADALVVRDDAGLPYLPGRTVKGLVRDAMELAEAAGIVERGRTESWLGTPSGGVRTGDDDEPERLLEARRHETEPGVLWFGSAKLPESWLAWARSADSDGKSIIDQLYAYVASTAIDKEGVAAEHTLRVSEVTVPMTLRAVVKGPDEEGWVEDVRAAIPLLRCLGARRQRGYGRVRAEVEAP